MSLSWNVTEPKPNPFEAIVGDDRTYVVHYTKTDSVSELEIRNDLEEIVLKALSINKTPHARKANTVLTLWDKVYCQITVVFTDSTLLNDASIVTKCTFEGLDAKMWNLQKNDLALLEQESRILGAMIRVELSEIFKRIDTNEYPYDLRVLFTDEERVEKKTFEIFSKTV